MKIAEIEKIKCRFRSEMGAPFGILWPSHVHFNSNARKQIKDLQYQSSFVGKILSIEPPDERNQACSYGKVGVWNLDFIKTSGTLPNLRSLKIMMQRRNLMILKSKSSLKFWASDLRFIEENKAAVSETHEFRSRKETILIAFSLSSRFFPL